MDVPLLLSSAPDRRSWCVEVLDAPPRETRGGAPAVREAVAGEAIPRDLGEVLDLAEVLRSLVEFRVTLTSMWHRGPSAGGPGYPGYHWTDSSPLGPLPRAPRGAS